MRLADREDRVRKRERKRGWPSEHVGFRCPKEIVESASAEGASISEGMVVMLDRARDAREALGKDWVEIVVFANREGITEGEALGRLAKAGLGKVKR